MGLADSDITLVSGNLSSFPSMLESGSVDAVSIWEPAMQNAVNAIGDAGVEFEFDEPTTSYREMVSLYTIRQKLEDPEKRRAIVGFLRALASAARTFRESPEEAQPYAAMVMNVDASLVAQFWSHENFPGKLVADFLDQIETEELCVASRENRTPRTRTELAMLLDDTPALDEALAVP